MSAANPNDVPLVRRFRPVAKDAETDRENSISYLWGSSKQKEWSGLVDEYRVVILADAGAGKTFEMQSQARKLKEKGKAAFFIRIEDIEENFESAFEIGASDEFAAWLSSAEECWFFLDSVDEARLDNPRRFEKAIRTFATKIHDAQHRAHIFISSRPYAWRPKLDAALVQELLPWAARKAEEAGEATDTQAIADDEPAENPSADEEDEDESPSIYWLAHLDGDDIRLFAQHRATPNIPGFIHAIERANLWSMAERPFDLDDLLAKWQPGQPFGDRLDILQYGIGRRLKEIDPDRDERQPLNLDKALAGARGLAAAVTLSGQAGIQVPEGQHNHNGIDAATLLSSWHSSEVKALLARGIFNDAIYGTVRFRHREVRELLTAEWLRDLLVSGARHRIEDLIFAERYGEKVVRPTMRPILPWLVLFDEPIRRRALALVPEVAVEGGDAARLPLAERRAILNDIVKRIASDEDDRSARDNSAIARIAQRDLSPAALRLIEKYRDNHEVIFFLGRLVWQGEMTDCTSALLEIASTPEGEQYARLASIRAVMTVGTDAERAQLWRAMTSEQTVNRRLAAEVLEGSNADETDVGGLLQLLVRLDPYHQFESTGLTQALHHFIDRLPLGAGPDATEPLVELVAGLNDILDTEPHYERGECRVSKEHAWLMEPALHAAERLIEARNPAAMSSTLLGLLLKKAALRHWGGSSSSKRASALPQLVPAWPELNDALFWASVGEVRRGREADGKRLIDDWPVLFLDHYWQFDQDGFDRMVGYMASRELPDDRLVALSRAHRIYAECDRPAEWRERLADAAAVHAELAATLDTMLNPPPAKQAEQWRRERENWERRDARRKTKEEKDRAGFVAQVKGDPSLVRSPPGLKPGEFSYHQGALLGLIEGDDGLRRSRAKGAAWRELIPEFGEDVATAFRDAAMAHWRAFVPGLGSEGTYSNSIPYALIFAIVGLEIESGEAEDFPSSLDDAEVAQALRYLVWELNGFPKWLEHFHATYPERTFAAIWRELQWELESGTPENRLHYILHDLVYHAPWLHARLTGPIHDWLCEHDTGNFDCLCYCLHILVSGQHPSESLAALAKRKIDKGVANDQLPNWYALWVDADPDAAIPSLAEHLDGMDFSDASLMAQSFIATLMGERRSQGPSIGGFHSPRHLGTLYALMHRFIRSADDIHRSNTGAYSPVLRDDAQDARNRLFSMLVEIPGRATYTALIELAGNHPDDGRRHWIAIRARARAVTDSDLDSWTAEQVRDFASEMELTPTTHRQLFDLATARIVDFKQWLETGHDSLAATYQKAESEAEVRNIVASWMKVQARGRYTCVQEPELANAQRPDIWFQNPAVGSAVPVEIKLVDKSWSGPTLCERLRNQLAGDYLREEAAGCGIMLLIWQGHALGKQWEIEGCRVSFADLPNALETYWQTVAANYPGIEEIRVIGIDLSVRATKSEDRS